MLRIRFKRCGRNKKPRYRIVLMKNTTKRDGKVIEDLGFYNPFDKTFQINRVRTIMRLDNGAQPSEVVKNLFRKSDIF